MNSNRMKDIVGKQHSFNVPTAIEYGVNKAILLSNLNFWTENAKRKNENKFKHTNGMWYYWTQFSGKAFVKRFPYMNKKNIARWMRELEKEGLIVSSEKFNKFNCDRTKWYSVENKVIIMSSINKPARNLTPHSFAVDHAKIFGVYKAIVLFNICYWLEHNRENQSNIHKHTDGKNYYWMYDSVEKLRELQPYFTRSSMQRWLKELEKDGVLKVNNFNKAKYDRTKWYSGQGFEVN